MLYAYHIKVQTHKDMCLITEKGIQATPEKKIPRVASATPQVDAPMV